MKTQDFKPILFSTEMVQAILDGRKTQTRRVLNKQPKADESKYQMQLIDDNYFGMCVKEGVDDFPYHGFFKPKYQPGDILWVRETFIEIAPNNYEYKAGFTEQPIKWKPSLFMPKEAARIFLKVTNVRVERLQDITEVNAINEGIKKCTLEGCEDLWENYNGFMGFYEAKDSFQSLWQSINAKKHPWESNPWVWVYTFKRIEKPQNFLS